MYYMSIHTHIITFWTTGINPHINYMGENFNCLAKFYIFTFSHILARRALFLLEKHARIDGLRICTKL